MSKFKNMKLRYKVATGVATTAAVVGLGGAAFAYFTSTGSGDGTATTGSASHWTVSPVSSTATDLVPNAVVNAGVIDTLNYSILNVSKGIQNLASAKIEITSVDNGTSGVSGDPSCSASDFSIDGQQVGQSHTQTIGLEELGTSDTGYSDTTVGTTTDGTTTYSNGLYNGTFTLQLVDNGANQDYCQGATVHFTVSAA